LKKLVFPASVLIFLLAVAAYFLFRPGPGRFEVKIDRTQQITHDPGLEIDPALSPDGKMIAYAAGTAGKMSPYVRQVAGGRPIALTTSLSRDCRWPQWSPDGRWVAYTWAHCLRLIPREGGKSRILVETSDPDILPAPIFPAWSKDSRTVYYLAYDAERRASFWSVPVSGGRPKLLVRFDDPSRQSSRYEFAADGERFYFTLAKYASDSWVGELSISRRR